MGVRIDAAIAGKIGFASHQNAVPLVQELRLGQDGPDALDTLVLSLTADPPFLVPRTWTIDRLAPGTLPEIADRRVDLNATFLGDLTESLSGTVSLTLACAGEVLAELRTPVEVLARGEWGGLGTMAELLPAFVMPNDPAVAHVLKAASDALVRSGRDGALDGYRSGKGTRVWELTAAIWSAVCGLGLSYALPPASFETRGQKVRTPGAILDGRIATCLDTALLFAAALEEAGLHPVLVMTEGHAFTGVWLQPMEFATLAVEEAAALRRRVALGELVLFETTLATQPSAPPFSAAIKVAERLMDEAAEAPFRMAIDIHRARMQKIRPLADLRPAPAREILADGPSLVDVEAPPVLPEFEREQPQAAGRPVDRITEWQRRLLNLTTGNRLLHVPASSKGVALVCPDPGLAEDRLASGRQMRLLPMPDLSAGGRDTRLYEAQTHENLPVELAREMLTRDDLLCALSKDKLEAALTDLYRRSRTDLEEGGTNTLFLAVGFLRWKKKPTETRSYRAPLILIPVKLIRRNLLSGMRLALGDDEARFNLTLLELLRQDFALTVPELDGPLPTDDSGIDVARVWQILRRAVRDMAGFEVVEDVFLGTFSFAKYLMWKDLADRADRLKESPLVRHLIEQAGTTYDGAGGHMPRPEELDVRVDPAGLFTPLPADSSQLAAVVASAEGHDFVLDGPPGTGKSQTIANMIAHNLALGRRVLFVAEKRAALEVVQRRLEARGLGDFCLDLHSAKATKTEVLKQLDRAWSTRDALAADDWAREAAEVRRLRETLNRVVEILHRRAPNGMTLHQAIGRWVRDGHDGVPRLLFAPAADHGPDTMATLRDIARRLGISRLAVAYLPEALSAVACGDWSNGWQEAIVAAAGAVLATAERLEEAGAALLAATRLPVSLDGTDLARLSALVAALAASFQQDVRLAFRADLAEHVAAAREALPVLAAYHQAETALSVRYAPEAARRIDVSAVRADWVEATGRMIGLSALARRKVVARLMAMGGCSDKPDPAQDLDHLEAMAAGLVRLDGLARLLENIPGYRGLQTEPADIERILALCAGLRAATAALARDPAHLMVLRHAVELLAVGGNEFLSADGPVVTAAARFAAAHASWEAAREDFLAVTESRGAPDDRAALCQVARAVLAHRARLKAWTDWQAVREEAVRADLLPLVHGVESGAIPPDRVPATFETAYARWFATSRIDAEPVLRRFSSAVHADDVAAFRRLDDRMAELSVRYIRARICGLIPDKDNVSKRDGGYAILKHQLQLQRRHKPIRQLASEMGDAFARLAPCMLMSPLSIAQYLPPDQALFDLVIFDEASQITPWDAIGALARGRQVVIAGDPRQMPPTNFFTRSVNGDDAEEGDADEDMESILDVCKAAGLRMHSLSWHYRSRHESLIAFSNHEYYGDSLTTFPAPVTRASAVSWQRVEGVYAKGKTQTNPIEARAIVDAVVARLTDPDFVASGQTLGIITLNGKQRDLIETLLEDARTRLPELAPFFAEDIAEPVVVKNLETVQGDERDVIFLGIGFGPTEPGGRAMSMNFGALNGTGGERRLNVAVTRARREMVVFTSFDPGMIDLGRTGARAVRDLKRFVDYADQGPRVLARADRGSVGGHDSPFEAAVADVLRHLGWTVVPQIGVSRFRIDLGIVHPDRPGDFLAGVECYGATYHSAATARDRDKVRAAILTDLGWTLVRIWSTDWWVDRAGSAEKLDRALRALLEADRRRVAEAAEAARLVAEEKARRLAEETAAREADAAMAEAARAAEEAARAATEEVSGTVRPVASESREGADLYPGATASPVEAERLVAGLAEPEHVYDAGPASRSTAPPAATPARPAATAGDEGVFRFSDLSRFGEALDPGLFYEAAYDGILARLIGHVLADEIAASDQSLVRRVARAHGFDRAGRVIQERVMGLAGRHHHVVPEDGGHRFIWLDAASATSWDTLRLPATAEDVRQIEDISRIELRAVLARCTSEDPVVEAARKLGVRRLSAPARARLESAR